MKVVSKQVVSLSSGYFFEFFTLLGLVAIYFKFWRYIRLIKICQIKPPDLSFLSFLVVFISCYISRYHFFISFYINRYHFSPIFRTSFHIIRKKDFRHKFSFLTDSLNPPPPPPLPKKKKSAKHDESFLLVLPKFCETALFQSVWLFQSYTNFITVIVQKQKL